MNRPMVYVIGDSMLDVSNRQDLYPTASEGNVPVLPECPWINSNSSSTFSPGGAANVAVNLGRMGCRVALLTPMSDDPEASILRSVIESSGNVVIIPYKGTDRTTVKRRYYANDTLIARVDRNSDSSPVFPKPRGDLLDLDLPDALVITDYGRGAVRVPTVSNWTSAFPAAKVFGDPKAGHPEVWRSQSVKSEIDTLSLNELELQDYVPVRKSWSPVAIVKAIEEPLFRTVNTDRVVIRRGADGSVLICRPSYDLGSSCDIFNYGDYTIAPNGFSFTSIPSLPPPLNWGIRDVQGAGDTYLAAMVSARCKGLSPIDSCYYASAAAGVAVSRYDTSAVDSQDVLPTIRNLIRKSRGKVSIPEAIQISSRLRSLGLVVGWTSGCFDVRLHAGHVNTLKSAVSGCDFLFVGVDSDRRVRALKGSSRPLIGQDDRSSSVSSVAGVGASVIFPSVESETGGIEELLDTIKAIRPDVVFKGGDYDTNKMPEKALISCWGGVMVHTGNVDCHSTSDFVHRLKSS